MFHKILIHQAAAFHQAEDDMNISAAYVHKSDLTEILNEDEIREIITSQSHKREPTPPPAVFSSLEEAYFGKDSDAAEASTPFATKTATPDMSKIDDLIERVDKQDFADDNAFDDMVVNFGCSVRVNLNFFLVF